jgi:hypothetical protein
LENDFAFSNRSFLFFCLLFFFLAKVSLFRIIALGALGLYLLILLFLEIFLALKIAYVYFYFGRVLYY